MRLRRPTVATEEEEEEQQMNSCPACRWGEEESLLNAKSSERGNTERNHSGVGGKLL